MLKSVSAEQRNACYQDCNYRALAHSLKDNTKLDKICKLKDSDISIDLMSKTPEFGTTLEEWSQTKFYYCSKSTMPASYCMTNLCK